MPEQILEARVSDQHKEDYVRYGLYIIYRRVLSDFRDGFKPVQRRILYAMLHDTKAVGHTVKSAAVVGDVMKHYHSHGDQALYGSIKPLVNWWESYMPLIDKQGNFGSFQGSPAAAARYTECKLSKFSMECVLGDLIESEQAVDWEPNYSETCMEPAYLPVKVPLLLINGSFGIGLGEGMKSDIPSHNINEVIDATIALMKDPNYDPILAPDHCMKCEIIDTDWRGICHTGFGNYRVRGVITQESYGNNKVKLVIRSTPNLTYLDTITDQIDKLVVDKKIIQIDHCSDESHGDDMRYEIYLKPGADPNYVIDMIYKNTKLEQNCRVNFETLEGLTPKRMSYKAYLQGFINFRMMTKFRVYTNRLQAVQTEIHRKEAYIAALQSKDIDSIIHMIRTRKEGDDASLIEFFCNKLGITDLQARYIINVPLKSLSKGYLGKYIEERDKLEYERDFLMEHIVSDDLIKNDIISEMLDIKAKYGCPRRCRIISSKKAESIPGGTVYVTISGKNFIRKVQEGMAIPKLKGDWIKASLRMDNQDNLILFDAYGKVFKLPAHKIPLSAQSGNGTDVRYLIKNTSGTISSITTENTLIQLAKIKKNKCYLIPITHKGIFKRMDLDDFLTVNTSGIVYMKLDGDDYVQKVIIAQESDEILVHSGSKAIRVPVSEIPYLKRNTRGSRSWQSATIEIDGAEVLINGMTSEIIIVTDTGKVNMLPTAAIPDKSRKVFNMMKLAKGDHVCGILTAQNPQTSALTIIRASSATETVPLSQIPVGSSISGGQKIFNGRADQIVRCFISEQGV